MCCFIKMVSAIIMLCIFLAWLLFMLALSWLGFHIGFVVGMIPLVLLFIFLYSPVRSFFRNFPMYKVIFKEDFHKAQEEAKRKYNCQ